MIVKDSNPLQTPKVISILVPTEQQDELFIPWLVAKRNDEEVSLTATALGALGIRREITHLLARH